MDAFSQLDRIMTVRYSPMIIPPSRVSLAKIVITAKSNSALEDILRCVFYETFGIFVRSFNQNLYSTSFPDQHLFLFVQFLNVDPGRCLIYTPLEDQH
mmetsp:Transcript_1151/g.2324  ORF Transcript_1151/g.2324 Transcript_1151/m.2324 type:complete len:98 (-) Transcript_1151:35-328(-)